jgi:hypothetical protein
VGEDGVRLVRPAPFEPGRPVEIAFALPDGPTLRLRAEVWHTRTTRRGAAVGYAQPMFLAESQAPGAITVGAATIDIALLTQHIYFFGSKAEAPQYGIVGSAGVLWIENSAVVGVEHGLSSFASLAIWATSAKRSASESLPRDM